MSQIFGNNREFVVNLVEKSRQQLSSNLANWSQQNDIEEHKERGLALMRQLCDQMGGQVQKFIRPVQHYTDLVTRYQRWFQKHKALESRLSSEQQPQRQQIRPAMDLVREEYAKLDEELMREKCAGQAQENSSSSSEKDAEKSNESVDFVFELLDKLTSRLEARLELEAKLADASDTELEQGRPVAAAAADEQQVANALERVKRIALKSAAELAIREVPRLARIVAVRAAANHFAVHPSQLDSPMLIVEQMVRLLDGASLPLAVMYLRDIQTRTALIMFDIMLPPEEIVCQLKQRAPILKKLF